MKAKQMFINTFSGLYYIPAISLYYFFAGFFLESFAHILGFWVVCLSSCIAFTYLPTVNETGKFIKAAITDKYDFFGKNSEYSEKTLNQILIELRFDLNTRIDHRRTTALILIKLGIKKIKKGNKTLFLMPPLK